MDFYTLSFLCFPQKSAAGVTFMEETDRNLICLVYKVVIEYHIYYFPICTVRSPASISRASSDFISSARDDLCSAAVCQICICESGDTEDI